MNTIDFVIIGIIGIMAISGYVRGLISTLFNMISLLLSIAITYYLYPYVSRYIMTKTLIYNNLSDKISGTFELNKVLENAVQKEDQINSIQALQLPKGIKEMLFSNNNPDMFKLLNVTSFKEYISGSLASITINVIIFVMLFVLISLILTLLIGFLNLVSKSTPLNPINKSAGALLGIVMSIAFVFMGLAMLSVIIATTNNLKLFDLLNQSLIGAFLYNNNPIIDLVNNNLENNHFWKIIAAGMSN